MHVRPLSVPEAARKFGVPYTTLKSWIGFGYVEQTGAGQGSTLAPAELDRLEVLTAFVEVGFKVSLAAELLRPDSSQRRHLAKALDALERWYAGQATSQAAGG